MYAIISPAKRQSRQTGAYPHTSQPFFKSKTSELVQTLQPKTVDELQQLMSVSANLAILNHQRYHDFDQSNYTEKNSHPAAFFFQGDVYQGLDTATWTTQDCMYSQRYLGILSGLYGWLKPLDLVQPYRLEMKTALANTRGKDLYAFWGHSITDAIAQHMRENNINCCVNLASIEYAKVVQPERLPGQWLQVAFKEPGPNGLRVVALRAKRARGLLAAYMMQQRVQDRDHLRAFAEEGYAFSAAHSNAQCDVFIRQS